MLARFVLTWLCRMLQEGFKPVVKDAHGFEYRPERPAAPTFVLQKWGWSGLQPGVEAQPMSSCSQLQLSAMRL